MSFSQIAGALNGEVKGDDAVFTGAAIDTRLLGQGELFVVFAGNRVDGHDMIPQARQQGAAGALVQRFVDDVLPQLKVPDTRVAFGQVAARWRDLYQGTVLALTGSNGKTSVKEMLATLLQQAGAVWATRGNFNNDIGMPLTLMGLQPQHRYAVIEMGANHPGEIAYLTSIARPDLAIITNAGPAHLEGFGSIEG
ncbi:MAG: UDP-N-acetylmuramoyl-tripeptide--D-alanyl-D-alanine ligase, partial [Nitrospira sp.]|nr:UDP-N-acetylmuramoyl-tripeptide--D-alanyl-D-alanine ligase [Nitrospira sp.]